MEGQQPSSTELPSFILQLGYIKYGLRQVNRKA